jgi:hypothetical protein
VICDSGPTYDLSVIVNSLPRSGLLPVPQALQTAPAQLWQAVYQRLAMAILDPPTDWPPAAQQQGVSATPMLFVVGDRLYRHGARLPRASTQQAVAASQHRGR